MHEVTYPRHLVSSKEIANDTDRIKIVKLWPALSNLCNFRSLLWLSSYYQRFIEGFSTLSKLLTKLTEKDNKFVLGEDQANAWEGLKRRLTRAQVLAYSSLKTLFVLDTSARGIGNGPVLSQEQDEKEMVYSSRTLT